MHVCVRACGWVCASVCILLKRLFKSGTFITKALLDIRITFNYFSLVLLTCQTSDEHALSAL